uniref:C2 domain-containing protein n=1 Tax=Strongyloides papillosus TaxID=174720 RepID=A0A0N5B9R0_STREA
MRLTLSIEDNNLQLEKTRSRIRSFSVFDQKSASLRQQDYSSQLNNSFLNVPGMARSNSIMLSPHHHPPEHRRLPHSPYGGGTPSSTNNRTVSVGGGYPQHFQSPSLSHNGSYIDIRSSLNSSNSSISSSLHPNSGRRKLPIAPDQMSGGIDAVSSPRRCSSPRMLPSSPCMSPMASSSPSPPYQCNNNYHPTERRPSGRRLPEPPDSSLPYHHHNVNRYDVNNVSKLSNNYPPNPNPYNVPSIPPSNYAPPPDISMGNLYISPKMMSNDLSVRKQLPMKKSSCIVPPTAFPQYENPRRRNSSTQHPHINEPSENVIAPDSQQVTQHNLLPNPYGLSSKQITKSESTLTNASVTTSSNEPSRRSSIVQERDAFRFRNGSMAHLFEQQHLIQIRDKSPSRMSTNTLESQYSTDQLNSISSVKSRGSVDREEDGNISTVGSISSSGSAVTTSENKKPENLGLDPSHYTGKENKPDVVVLSASGQKLSIHEENKPKGLGVVTCTLQHFPVRKRLRVTVIKVEGLAGELKPNLEILPFCRVTLYPGKHVKSQDSIVKRGRDAVFNQEFFFDNVTSEDLDTKNIQVVFLHQSSQKLQKDAEIGEFSIELKDFPLLHDKKEVKIVDELKVKFNTKKLGKIYFSTQISKEAKTLTINVNKVEDLPKWGLIGAPDVCVRVTVIQGENKVQTKQSRVLKNTCKAVYQESIMFLISTKMNDLRKTQIIVSAIDMQRHGTGDDVIGSSYLGSIAMDKSEIDQWKNTVEHLGKEYKASHHLKLEKPVVNEPVEEEVIEKVESKKELGIDDFDEWLK